MASSSMTLLQVVALVLPAIAILMQVILQVQSRGSDSNVRFSLEFRVLELVIILLVLSGGAFSYEIVGTLDSEVATIGLGLMMLAMLLVVPAIVTGVRRGTMEGSPEDAFKTQLSRFRTPAIAVSLFVGLSVVIAAVYLRYPEITSQSPTQYLLITILVTTVVTFSLRLANEYTKRRVEELQRNQWRIETEEIIYRLRRQLLKLDGQPERLFKNPRFRGTLLRILRELNDQLKSQPEDVDGGTAEQIEKLQEVIDTIPEIQSTWEKADRYVIEVETELERLQQQLKDINEEIETSLDAPVDDLQKHRVNVEEKIDNYTEQREEALRTQSEIADEAEALLEDVEEVIEELRVGDELRDSGAERI